jgi:beta-lactam-binding protein with PASTA domain
MKRGCSSFFFVAVLAVLVFGGSTYFWFTFFVKGRSLPTPHLVGRSVADARAVCSDLGVALNVDEQHRRNSDKVPVGHIVWQNREPGSTNLIKRGTTIRVELSAGPLVLRVPDLNGQTQGTAILRLGQQNMKPGAFAFVPAAGRGIIAADPPVGTVVKPQEPVALLVAVPPPAPTFVMPDLIDLPLDRVRPSLEAKGLNVATVRFETYPGIPDGIIIRQFPMRGAPVSSRDAITVVVSRQEETSIVEQPAQQ